MRAFLIGTTKRVAFSGRIKALIKYGVPMRPRLGRGHAAKFSGDHLLQLAVALALTRAGLSPQTSAQIVKGQWWMEKEKINAGLKRISEGYSSSGIALGWMWIAYVDAFEDLKKDSGSRPVALEAVPPSQLYGYTEWGPFTGYQHERAIVLNPAIILTRLIQSCVQVLDWPCAEDWALYYRSLEDKLDDNSALFEEHIEYLEVQAKSAGEGNGPFPGADRALRLFKSSSGQPYGMRALSYCLSAYAQLELRWVITPPNLKNELLDIVDEEVLTARKAGQDELVQLGLVTRQSDEFADAPDLTDLGRRYLEFYGPSDGTDNVDPKA